MRGLKKWLVGTFFSCINQVEDQELVCSHPKIVTCSYSGNVTPAQYARMPIPSSNTPVHTNIDIHASDISMNNKEEREEAKQDNNEFAPSFRYFVFDTESRNPSQAVKEGQIPQQHLNPEVEEFSFWPSDDWVPKEFDQESDEVFLQDQILPTLLSSSDGDQTAINPPAEDIFLPIHSSNEEPGIPEEDFDPDDLKDCFELPKVNTEIAEHWKLYGGLHEEKEENEKQDDRDQILPTLMISSDGDQTAINPLSEGTFPPIPAPINEEHGIPGLEDYSLILNSVRSADNRKRLEVCFLKLNAAFAQSLKLHGGYDGEEKEEHEKQEDKDQILPTLMTGSDGDQTAINPTFPPIRSYKEKPGNDVEDRFVKLHAAIAERCKEKARTTSRCISMDQSCSYSSGFTSASSTSSPQSANKPDCCIVPRQITKAEILFSKISRIQKTAFWRLLRAPVHTSKTSASRARLDRMSKYLCAKVAS